MSRFAEIEAEQQDLRQELEIMQRIRRLEREKKSLRGPQQFVDLTYDEEDDGKVKVEVPEEEGTDVGGNKSREATQNFAGDGEAFSADQDFNAVDEARLGDGSEHHRPALAAVRLRGGHIEGPRDRAGRSHHQNSTTRGANSFSVQRGPPAPPQQPQMHGLPPPMGLPPPATFGRRFNPIQQWHRDAPDHDSTYGTGNMSPPEERGPVAQHQMAAARPSFQQAGFPPDTRRNVIERGPPYGQAQPNQAAQSHQMYAPQGTQPERRGLMGQRLGMVDNRGPAQTHIPAPPTVALEGYAYDKHSVYQTLVGKPDGSGFWELRCYVCGANVTKNGGKAQKGKPQGGQFFSGVQGFQNHIRICHPGELGEDGKNLSPATIIERCKVRELSHEDINAMRSKHGGAYKIDKKVGASADPSSAVRKPHPWKKRTDPPDLVNGKHVPRKRRKAQAGVAPHIPQGLEAQSGSARITGRAKGKQRRVERPLEAVGDEDDVDEAQDNANGEVEHESEEEPRRRLTRGKKTGSETNKAAKASSPDPDDFLALVGMEGNPAGLEENSNTTRDEEWLPRLNDRVGMEEVSGEGSDSGAEEDHDED
ncbi:hypothetical protein PRZ48_009651 [Zasmidium cellare]|uniref:BED-type domain-containing protein n=1 Tax=Zasmidium cellare TaxID=395010 RepID=A0ABR0ECP5_ZASCE|nr:hypothetical protein PRZ48_009651 [Zasmidium cellare]